MRELVVRMEDNGQLTPVCELVRCKNCEFRSDIGTCHYDKPMGLWDKERTFVNSRANDDFYCAHGKQKED